MKKVLLVDDSKEIFRMVEQSIGLTVSLDWASDIKMANELVNNNYDLVLLDIALPDGNGVEFCSAVQSVNPLTAIFFLTSHDSLSEKVLGFSAGADDYITKPFDILELKARVEAKLRKMEYQSASLDKLKWKEVSIDKNRQEVSVVDDQGAYHKVELTALEFKLLTFLANQPGHVIHRDKILDEIWGENIHVYSRSVDTHVSKLRKKLGSASHVIESVHGAGYKFSPTPV